MNQKLIIDLESVEWTSQAGNFQILNSKALSKSFNSHRPDFHDHKLAIEAIEAGCNEVIRKPLDFENLKPLLNQYLS